MRLDPIDLIVNYYKNQHVSKIRFPEEARGIKQAVSFNGGIGDSVIINTLSYLSNNAFSNISIYSSSNHFNDILNFNLHRQKNNFNTNYTSIAIELMENYDLGCGHATQKIRRAFDLGEIEIPGARLFTGEAVIKNRIGIHLSTGNSAFELSHLKKMPRQIYPNNLQIIKDFINENKNKYDFIEFGGESVGLDCQNFCGKSLNESIIELSKCEYFIGLNSGFMNIAASLQIKSIIIVNIPDSSELILPKLKDTSTPDLVWLYPQNVHLHQDNETTLVPIFSKQNLLKAINGYIYPYWSNNFLNISI
jgi:hypothetical protein